MNDNSEIKLWERQPGETAKAYSYFCRYRDMGSTRSHDKVARELGKARITMSQMAHKWSWSKRVNAYADELERIRMELARKEIAEMVRRHSEHAQAVETSLMVPVKIFINKIKNSDIRELQSLASDDLLKLVFSVADKFPNIVNTERKSRGIPTEISSHNVDHTTKGKEIQSPIWDTLKIDMIKNLEGHPEAKESLLKVLDKYVNTGTKD